MQNNVFLYLLTQMRKLGGKSFIMPDDTIIYDFTLKSFIKNNKEYLSLLQSFKKNTRFSYRKLRSIEKSLGCELLTLTQQIRAYYIIGNLYSRSPKIHGPPCFFYAVAWQLMVSNRLSRINLYWDGKATIQASDLREKICFH
jgi:hypothetical protein